MISQWFSGTQIEHWRKSLYTVSSSWSYLDSLQGERAIKDGQCILYHYIDDKLIGNQVDNQAMTKKLTVKMTSCTAQFRRRWNVLGCGRVQVHWSATIASLQNAIKLTMIKNRCRIGVSHVHLRRICPQSALNISWEFAERFVSWSYYA